MEEIPLKILIMGSGAVGSYFGAVLHKAGHDVLFVARGAHLEACLLYTSDAADE